MTEILHALPLYIDKTDDSTENKLIYRVLFPECIIHNIEPDLRHLPILNGLQKYASILSSGELLEYLTSNIIMLRIMTMQKVWPTNLKWKDVSPCYKQSKHIAEMAVDVNLSEMVFFPKVTTKAKKLDNQDIKEELKTLPWSHDVSIDDWSWLVTNIAKVKHFHKPKPMSQSCDLFFYPTNGIMVGYALKNYGEGTSFTISMLQEEIFKAAMVMKGASIQKFTLFVLSRTLKSLQGLFTSEHICRIDSGRFIWSNNELSKIDEKKRSLTYFEMKERLKSKEASNNLAVPEGMEVIVLGERAFEEFFGKEVVELLKDIATHQAIQSTSLSLLRRVIKKGLFTEEVLGPVNQKEKITSRNKISSGYSSSQSIESDACDTQGIIIRYEDDEGDMRRVRVKSLVELKLIIANEWKRDPDHIHKIRYRDGDELVAVKNEHCFKLIPNKTTVIVTWHDL